MAAVRAVLCVFVTGIVRLNRPPAGSVESMLPYGVAGAAFLLNLAGLALSRRRLSPGLVAGFQIWVDVAFISAFVYLTGGVGSDFLLLYFGPILAGAICFRRPVALLVASLSTIGLFACAAYYGVSTGGPPLVEHVWVAEGRGDSGALVGVLAIQGVAFHLVAFLAATLALRLRSASIHTEQILENMSDGVVTVGKNGRIVFSNSRATAMLGVDPAQTLIGSPFHKTAPRAAREGLRRVISTGRAEALEAVIGDPSIPVMVTILPLSDQAGRLRGANVVLHDLTERRRLTEALRRAERLEATAATVASIAHEIRNPLAAIRASTQELSKVLELSDQDRHLMNLVVNESDRLNRILTEFLKFSSVGRLQPARTELRSLLEGVAAELAVLPAGRNAKITVAGEAEITITADAEKLWQVFLNLGLNALEATAGRGPVTFHMRQSAEGAVVETLDGGPGVDPSITETMFEPFFTTKTTGTGLGLAIVRRIVEDHKGRVELGAPRDGETCIKVFLPFAEGSHADGPSAEGPPEGQEAQEQT